MPTNEELQQQITELASKVEGMKVDEVSEAVDSMQLKYPLDIQSTKIIEDIIRDKIIDIVWEDYFYYSNFFDSLDGWSLADSSGGGSGTTGAGVTLETGASTNNASSILKFPDHASVLSFDKKSRFKSGFEILTVTTDNLEFNITFGQGRNGDVENHYGFRLQSGILKGVSADGSTESTVDLISISVQTRYLVEAWYFPSEKVVFLVSNAGENEMIERGTLITNLPTGSIGITNNSWFQFHIKTLENVFKQAYFSFIEYIQKR